MKSQYTKFWCGWCGRGYRKGRKVAKHSNMRHKGAKLLMIRQNDNICPHCDLHMVHSKFQTFISHLTTCILNKRRNPPGIFPCGTCAQSFRRRDNLVQHKLRFHSAKAVLQRNDIDEPQSPQSDPSFVERCYEIIYGKIDPNLLIQQKSTSVKEIRQLKARGTTTTFRFTKLFKSLSKCGYLMEALEIVFGHLISDFDLRKPNVFTNLCLDSDDQLSYPIKTPLIKSQDFDLSLFLKSVEAVCQSRTALGMDGDLTLELTTCVDPTVVGGSGTRVVSSKIAYFSEFLQRKSGVLDPTPLQQAPILKDACIAICVAFDLYGHFISKSPKFTIKMTGSEQKRLPNKAYTYIKQFYDILELPYASGVQLDEEKLNKIHKWLSTKYNTRLLVHSIDQTDLKQISLVYSGNAAERTLHLLLYDSHCYLITDCNLMFGGYNFCEVCELVHQKGKCQKRPICHLCHGNDCYVKTGNSSARTTFCDDCSKWFKNQYCFDQHIELDVCNVEKRCLKCYDHDCFIPIQPICPTKENQIYIFADLESRIDPDSKVHRVVLAYAIRVCERCIHNWVYEAITPCCGNREFSFFGEIALGDFIKWLAYNETNSGAICFCHYGGGYDFILMLEEVLRLRHRPKRMITRNLRIISMTIGQNVKCRDSFNLFRLCPHYHTGKETEVHPLFKPMTYEEVFQKKTQFKADYIESTNWKLETIWTCSIEKQLKEDDALASFFTDYKKTLAMKEPINGRSALFGGRTGTNHLLVLIDEKMFKDGWALEYIDIISLYPHIMSVNAYPTSHPVIKNHYDFHKNGQGYSKTDLGTCLGIYKCTVVFDIGNRSPPIFPVLPTKVGQKLVFAICNACALACDNNADCDHSANERALDGCWTNVELIRAIDQGFEIKCIHQAWLFKESSFTLFEKYMKTYATLKYKAGFPATLTTDNEKSAFVQTLQKDMDVEDVKENPALRSFAKSILVNLWGKLGESCEKNASRCNFVETTDDLTKLINDREVEITNMKILTDKHLLVETKTKQEFYMPNQFHNPVISSFVTAYGRLYLLDTLEHLGNLVLYYDTDSCIFLYQKDGIGEKLKPETGELFGQFKSELQVNEYGIKFLSLAPKMYALLTNTGRLIFRAKGISLDDSLGKHLKKFDTLTAILLQNSDQLHHFYDALEDKELGTRLKQEHDRRVKVYDNPAGAVFIKLSLSLHIRSSLNRVR